MKQKYRSEFNRRQNMLADNFEIYYYSDSHFQNVSPHTHDYYEFYFPVAGQIEMEIRNARFPLSHREVVIVPPRTLHRAVTLSSEKSYCRYIFWISKEYFESLCRHDSSCRYLAEVSRRDNRFIFRFSENEYAMLQSKILRLMEEDRSARYGREMFLEICIYDLLMTLNRMVYEKDYPERTAEPADLFQSITEYIDQHVEEDLSLGRLGELFFVSKYHIAHLFKEHLGISTHQYITRKRLALCAARIAEGKQVTEICTEYGFGDYSSFYRAFRREYGLSPKDYQNVHLHDPLRSTVV